MKNLVFLLTLFCFLCFQVRGQFWTQVNTVPEEFRLAPGNADSVYAMEIPSYNAPVYRAEMDGSSPWTSVSGSLAQEAHFFSLHGAGGRVFMMNHNVPGGGGDGIYISDDGGANWTLSNAGLGADLDVLAMYDLANGVLMCQGERDTFFHNLYRSTDNGDSWNSVFDPGGLALDISTFSPTESYMTAYKMLFKSTDNGLSWTGMEPNMPLNNLYTILPGDAGKLLATSDAGLLESTDGGMNWTVSAAPGLSLATPGWTGVVHAATGYLYLGTDPMLYSTDSGNSWALLDTAAQPFNGTPYFTSMFINSNDYLFVSTPNSGVYRSSNPLPSPTTLTDRAAFDLNVEAYPNPNKGVFSLLVQADKASEYRVRLMAVTGETLGETMHRLGPGKHEIELDWELEAGLYLVEVSAEKGRKVKKVLVQ